MHNSRKSQTKILLIGIDGATFDLLNPWINNGLLPNIKRVIENGAYGKLRSTIPPVTGTAWPSFKTGKNPGKTGIPDFLFRNPQKMEFKSINSERIVGPTIWEILNQEGKRTIILFEPTSYPVKEINGIIIAGFLTPSVNSKFFTFPQDILERYNFNRNCLTRIRIPFYFRDNKLDDFEKDLLKNLQSQIEIALKLIETECWDFFMIHFFATDLICHAMWKFMDKKSPIYQNSKKYADSILRIYKKVDEAIGSLLQKIDNNTYVIIMSDHGFGPTYKHFFINQWLVQKGLLKIAKSDFNQVLSELAKRLKRKVNNEFLRNIVLIIEKLIFETFKSFPEFIRNRINDLVSKAIDKLPENIKRRVTPVNYFDRIDWKRTKAYALNANGGIYLNLKERELKGIVTTAEYEKLRDYIIKELERLEDEKGHKIVSKVYKKEEIYWGEHIEMMPDLIPDHYDLGVEFNCDFSSDNVLTNPPEHRSGTHRSEGIIIISGEKCQKNKVIEGAHIIDIMPTILYLMGLPISKNIDGKVLKNCFVQDYLNQQPVRYDGERETLHKKGKISRSDEEEIMDRLKGLGYM